MSEPLTDIDLLVQEMERENRCRLPTWASRMEAAAVGAFDADCVEPIVMACAILADKLHEERRTNESVEMQGCQESWKDTLDFLLPHMNGSGDELDGRAQANVRHCGKVCDELLKLKGLVK